MKPGYGRWGVHKLVGDLSQMPGMRKKREVTLGLALSCHCVPLWNLEETEESESKTGLPSCYEGTFVKVRE